LLGGVACGVDLAALKVGEQIRADAVSSSKVEDASC
jgi:hypothetical protein